MSYAALQNRSMMEKMRAEQIRRLSPAALAAMKSRRAAMMAARGSRRGPFMASGSYVTLEKGIDIWGKIKKAVPAVAKIAVGAMKVVNTIAKVALPVVSMAAGALGIPPTLTSKVLGAVTKFTDGALDKLQKTLNLTDKQIVAVKNMNTLKVAENNIAVATQMQIDGKLSPDAAKELINKNIGAANTAQEAIKDAAPDTHKEQLNNALQLYKLL